MAEDAAQTIDPLQEATRLHRAGRLTAAEPIYRRILAAHPHRDDVRYLLGLLVYQHRNDPEAVDLIRRAIAADPRQWEYHSNLGVVLAAQHRFEEAVIAYRAALELNPRSGEALNNLGNALLHLGRIHQAAEACRCAVALMPDSVLAHYNLGNALVQLGQPEEAVGEYRLVLSARPNFAEGLSNLGNALTQLGRWEEAAEACRAALRLKPDYAAASNNLGGALVGLGKLQEAVEACTRAIALQPNYAEAYINLGNALKDQGRIDEVIANYHKAIALKPDFSPFHCNLGVALLLANKPDEALAATQRALVLPPHIAGAYNNLGAIFKDLGRIADAVDAYRRGVELEPNSVAMRSNLVLAAHYHPDYDGPALCREAEQWAAIHAEPLRRFIRPHRNSRDPDRVLIIGYVSPDFRDHVAGHILLPLVATHDHAKFKIACYSNVRIPDAITEQTKSHADLWRNIHGPTDDHVAAQIAADEIDILVDLALFTAENRLTLFARKPAPVQAIYLSYPGTSGMSAIDFRLSDPYLDPPDSDLTHYTEETIRLSKSYWHYQPGGQTPDVRPPPSIDRGYVTFGCMNNVVKLSQPALELWAKVLDAVDGSHLLVHSISREHQQTIISRLSNRGVASDRIEFVPKQKWAQFLDVFHRIDIALDPIPFGGGITTCDTLWMGVPVVTLSGQTAVGRGGRSILSNIGLPELVAYSPQHYVKIAADLARDSTRLAELRKTMRSRMQASPLMDSAGFIADIENAYRQMWRKYCARPL
jgi:protein O-GlcNAc transferase